MINLAWAGAADDGRPQDHRQRNIFPLPEIPEGAQSDPHSDGWERLANGGIKALNELSGCINSVPSKNKPTRAQRRVLSHIASAYQEATCAVDIDPGESCLAELCASSKIYQTDRSDVVSYARDLVSWPEVETFPVALQGCLPQADGEWLATWQQQRLKLPSEVVRDPQLKQPHTDPILKHNPNEYIGFLRELVNRNMIKFKRDSGEKAELGVFFVKKKNGKQRLIFDTRILNEKFHDPPKTDLPSADAFTRMEISGNKPFFIGSGDLANAFYTLAVPDSLGQMFTLPAIEAGRMKINAIDGSPLRPGDRIMPYLTVLPMGWSWALHLCQMVMDHAILTAGVLDMQTISDKGKPVHLESSLQLACAGYVDNYAIIGTDAAAVDAGLRRIGERLRSFGLTVHEECPAEHSGDFVGLSFNGLKGSDCMGGSKRKVPEKIDTSQRQKIERNLKRRKLVEAATIVPNGMTYLESRSVKQPTILDYTRRHQEFMTWCLQQELHPRTSEEMDMFLVEFLQQLFDEDRGINDGIRAVAAVKFFKPQFKNMPRVTRALRGWQIASPPLQRMPIPIEVLCAIIGELMKAGRKEMGLRLFLQFLTYLRPGECSSLTVKQLVPPIAAANQAFNFWAVLLHPAEDLEIFETEPPFPPRPWSKVASTLKRDFDEDSRRRLKAGRFMGRAPKWPESSQGARLRYANRFLEKYWDVWLQGVRTVSSSSGQRAEKVLQQVHQFQESLGRSWQEPRISLEEADMVKLLGVLPPPEEFEDEIMGSESRPSSSLAARRLRTRLELAPPVELVEAVESAEGPEETEEGKEIDERIFMTLPLDAVELHRF
eukprot:Skav229499  [mRNA]  locus=scaffold2455:119515:131643:- [translate_table: standard]